MQGVINSMTESRFEECISLICGGDTLGLKEIYEAYYRLIYSIMLNVTGNRTDSEDLTSDFFVKLWDKLAALYNNGNGHRTWLAAIARNMAKDHLRKSNRIKPLDSDDPAVKSVEESSSVSPENDALDSVIANELLSVLDETERLIVDLKLFADFTFKEIATTLHLPQGTVSWKYRKAISKMGETLKGGAER